MLEEWYDVRAQLEARRRVGMCLHDLKAFEK